MSKTRTNNFNKISTWSNKFFGDWVDETTLSDEVLQEAKRLGALQVRSKDHDIALCRCTFPHDAAWIAERLNLAHTLEEFFMSRFSHYKTSEGPLTSDEVQKIIEISDK